jgi:hypothetical protein
MGCESVDVKLRSRNLGNLGPLDELLAAHSRRG